MQHVLELHVIQSVPPSRLNRGRNGDPKSAVFGGVDRTRLSSQSQKRAQRDTREKRTRWLHTWLHAEVARPELDALITDVVTAHYGDLDPESGAMKTMVKVSQDDVDTWKRRILAHAPALSDLRAALGAGDKKDKAAAQAAYTRALAAVMDEYQPAMTTGRALFGAFIAGAENESVQAATSYAQAISTHRNTTANDFFTAIDDHASETSGRAAVAHLGDVALSAPTLYRYANVDLALLATHLGSEAAALQAAREWALGFMFALPRGGEHGAFAQTLPEYALLTTRRSGMPVTLANAFTEPAYPESGRSLLEVSVRKLQAQATFNARAYGFNGLERACEISMRPDLEWTDPAFQPTPVPSVEAAWTHLGL